MQNFTVGLFLSNFFYLWVENSHLLDWLKHFIVAQNTSNSLLTLGHIFFPSNLRTNIIFIDWNIELVNEVRWIITSNSLPWKLIKTVGCQHQGKYRTIKIKWIRNCDEKLFKVFNFMTLNGSFFFHSSKWIAQTYMKTCVILNDR